MGKFNFYDFLGVLADAAAKKNTAVSEAAPPAHESAPPKAPAAESGKKSFADKKTVVEMIRNHDRLSRKIDEAANKAEAEK